jgi:hypothetical protein
MDSTDILSPLRVLRRVESTMLGMVIGGSQQVVEHGRRYVQLIQERAKYLIGVFRFSYLVLGSSWRRRRFDTCA